jgi:hypothetical protein
VLHLVRAALPRVPLEAREDLRWRDVLPGRAHGGALRFLVDLIAPFLPHDGLEMEYRMVRAGAVLIVEGASLSQGRHGPLVTTRAELSQGAGPLRLSMKARGRELVAERAPDAQALPYRGGPSQRGELP